MPVPRARFAILLLLASIAGVHAAPPATDAFGQALEPLLAGEFALQAGQLDDAARHALDAARAVDDEELAERATRIALLAKDDARAAQALALWKRRVARGLELQAAEAALALRRGRDAEAIAHLSALAAAPVDDGWRQALLTVGTTARDNAQAARVVGALVDGDRLPRRLQAWMAFGGLAQRLEQPALVDRIVAGVVARFPDEPRAALLRASQLREADRRAEARAVLAGVREAAARDDDLRVALASEYDALGDLADAAAVLARGPQDERTWTLRASVLARAEDRVALTALYDEIARDAARPDPQQRLLLGQIAQFLERHDDALEWYAGVPGGPQRWIARLRSAATLHEAHRHGQPCRPLAHWPS